MRTPGFLIVCAAIAACSSAPTAPTAGRAFDVALHETVAVSGTGLSVRFDSVLGDSRCPIGAMCVWVGKASVRISILSGTDQAPLDLTSTPDSSTRLWLGWFVDFVALEPYPSIEPPPPGPPVLRVRIRQALD